MLRKLPKKPKRESRFRSQRHLKHVRSFACCVCDSEVNIEAAHVRLGSGAGMGQKPHDYYAVPLCKDCHQSQHSQGERTFWHGKDVQAIMGELIRTSPVRREIEQHRSENDG